MRSSSTSSKGDANTIAFLKQENDRLNLQITTLQSSISSASNTGKGQEQAIAQLRQENERLNQQIVTLQTTISTSSSTSTSAKGQ